MAQREDGELHFSFTVIPLREPLWVEEYFLRRQTTGWRIVQIEPAPHARPTQTYEERIAAERNARLLIYGGGRR